jgi:hypothetical protein
MPLTYIFLNQLWCRSPGNEGCGDYNVYFPALLQEKFHFSLDEFFGHLFCITSSSGSIFFDVYLNKFGSE